MSDSSVRPVNKASIRQLIKEYDQIGAADSESAAQLRQEILNMIQRRPTLLGHQEISRFLATSVEPEDIAVSGFVAPVSLCG